MGQHSAKEESLVITDLNEMMFIKSAIHMFCSFARMFPPPDTQEGQQEIERIIFDLQERIAEVAGPMLKDIQKKARTLTVDQIREMPNLVRNMDVANHVVTVGERLDSMRMVPIGLGN